MLPINHVPTSNPWPGRHTNFNRLSSLEKLSEKGPREASKADSDVMRWPK